MMERRIIKGLMIGMVLFSACYYDVEEELYPATVCNTENMSYQNHIVPILQQHCYSCHSAAVNNGNVTLEGYSQFIKYVNSGQLLGAIKHESGFSAMPQGLSSLIPCNIKKIEEWINQGKLNN